MEHESSLERRKQEFEAELEERRKSFEDEVEARRKTFEDRESELIQREKGIKDKENSIEVRLKEFSENNVDLANRLKLLHEREQNLQSLQKAAEIEKLNVQKEREEINKMQVDLKKLRSSLEDEKKAICQEQKKLEVSLHERNELLVLETKLKDEIDTFRYKNMELDAEADKLKSEKEKFEIEWELIDEKREELRKEAERIAEERKAICTYLKNEHDSIKLEKEKLHNHFKAEVESFSLEREEFMTKMEHEHSDWVIKIQREREDFVKDINIQRKELENCIEKRREEVETYLREKEEAFEQERTKELQHINSQKEIIVKQLEHVSSELKRLDNERMEIALDREQRERVWSEIKSSIEVLNIQREKLQKQRELLHADREEIYQKIQHLNRLESLDIESENRALSELHSLQLESSKFPIKKCINTSVGVLNTDDKHQQKFCRRGGSTPQLLPEKPTEKASDSASPPLSATVSLVKKYARAIFSRSPEKIVTNSDRNADCKTAMKLKGASAGKENGSASSNLFKKMAADGKKIRMSKLEYVDDTTLVSGNARSIVGEATETKELSTSRLELEGTNMTYNMPLVDINVECIPEIAHKNIADKVILQLKEDSVNGTVADVNDRKRLNDSLSNDHFEPGLHQKHQKKARMDRSDALEENSAPRWESALY